MNIDKLFEDYYTGMEIKDLCSKYNIKNSGTFYYYLRKFNKPNRGKSIPYNNPFIEESRERDYWLGWILSDGHIQNSKTHNYVYLACLDLDILLKFQNFCGDRAKLNKFKYTTPVSKETKTMYKVVINSKELSEYFKHTYGLSNDKASSLNPNIELNWDILRGVLDGDGSFKKGVVLTSRSELWINKIKKFYDDHNLHYTCTYDTAYRLGIYKKQDMVRVYDYLYSNTELYLERKRDDLFRLAM